MPSPLSRTRHWAGRGISAVAVLFLVFDATIKLMVIPPVGESFARLGFPVHLSRGIGTLGWARRFMALHQEHWKGWEEEVELRQLWDPPGAPSA